MTNHLAGENSPYLLQHAENPVEWYPWGPEALEKARAEDKPVFLSIGYSACHWCHVMAHESFEDPEIAALMNRYFVNIKVDREERPDLDGIYMAAVVALSGHGGWPMSVFITPDGKPFYGGTYFPPLRRYNMPAFGEVLQTLARLWQEDRPRLLENSQELIHHIQRQLVLDGSKEALGEETLREAGQSLARTYDWQNGGWGHAPKFPQPMSVEFLLRRGTRGDQEALEMALHALRAMAKGGMYDVVGGGFARYATDDAWLVPHFEKMLYDNAQLALAYLHAWQVSGEAHFRHVCEETLDFVLREMTDASGGFYSSLDADSEGEEGKFYLWVPEEIHAALGNAADEAFLRAAYGITAQGNFEGKTVLQRVLTDEQLAAQFGLPPGEVAGRMKNLHARLLAARAGRIRPGTDDKVLTMWNALALAALAEAGRYLERADYLAVAQKNARFLLDNLVNEGRLLRSWRAGQARHNAYLEDYAALILGLLALYQSDGDAGWYIAALRLAEEMIAHFSDPLGGFFDTRDDHEILLLRPKEVQDNATPSGNALAAEAMLQLAALEGRGEWRSRAEEMLTVLSEAMVRYPTAFARWLCAADFALGPVDEVALIGSAQDARTQALRQTLWSRWRPRLVAAFARVGEREPALLADRPLRDGLPAAYVCRGFVCQVPVTTPEELAAQLA